jgi:aminoglycoside phosphotransferase (APT) family kinase protein
VQQLLQVEITPAVWKDASVHHPALPVGVLHLNRIWPQSSDHWGLEYWDEQGRAVVGQWVNDEDEFQRVVKGIQHTVGPSAVWALPAQGVLLQLKGADRKLPGLAALATQAGATLIVHRPERRAVVRLTTAQGVQYAKVVRPARVTALAETMRTVHTLAAGHFATPAVLAVDSEQGFVLLSALPGAALHTLIEGERFVYAAGKMGATLRALHALPPSPGTPHHTAAAECQVLERWLTHFSLMLPQQHGLVQTLAESVRGALGASPAHQQEGRANTPVLLHRDFYDKQFFLDDADGCGLLDFDTLATGEAALDLANALVHFELRALQGACTWAQAGNAAQAMLAGYQPAPATQQRLSAYADATRLRLACVYACRPQGRVWTPHLLARIGAPLCGGVLN